MTITELEALLAKATAGPWAIANWGYTDEPHMVIEGPERPKPPTCGDGFWFGGQKAVDWGDEWDADNAALIVAMVNAAPDLIAAVRLLAQIADENKASAFHSCIELDTHAKDDIDGIKWMAAARALVKKLETPAAIPGHIDK